MTVWLWQYVAFTANFHCLASRYWQACVSSQISQKANLGFAFFLPVAWLVEQKRLLGCHMPVTDWVSTVKAPPDLDSSAERVNTSATLRWRDFKGVIRVSRVPMQAKNRSL